MADESRVGISTASFFPYLLTEEAVEAAASLGFHVLEAFLQAEEEYTLPFGEELGRRARDAGVRIHSLHLFATLFDLWSPYRRVRRETRDRYRRVLEIAHRCGATALTWHGLRYQLDNPQWVEPFLESTLWAAELAEEAGIRLCLENVSWCYLRRIEHVERIKALPVEIGFTFDIFQAAEVGVPVEAMARAMGGRMMTTHISDYADDGRRHLPPGEGLLDWESVGAVLHSIGYRGPLILEVTAVREEERLRRARDFLLRWQV